MWYFVRRPSPSKKILQYSRFSKDVEHLIEKQDYMPVLDHWEKWIETLYTDAFGGRNGSRRYFYFVAIMLDRLCYPFGLPLAVARRLTRKQESDHKGDAEKHFQAIQDTFALPELRPVEGTERNTFLLLL